MGNTCKMLLGASELYLLEVSVITLSVVLGSVIEELLESIYYFFYQLFS